MFPVANRTQHSLFCKLTNTTFNDDAISQSKLSSLTRYYYEHLAAWSWLMFRPAEKITACIVRSPVCPRQESSPVNL